MQSFEGNTFGSLDAFRLTARAMPEPSRGQVRIRVRATALGFADGLLVQGRYQIKPPLPYVPGGEIAGVVDAVGPEVSGLRLGARVATWQLGGGLAEHVIVAAEIMARRRRWLAAMWNITVDALGPRSACRSLGRTSASTRRNRAEAAARTTMGRPRVRNELTTPSKF